MNIFRLSIQILLGIMLVCSPLFAKIYTLDTLLKVGYAKSHDILSIQEEMQKVEAQVNEYYGKAMPTIDLNVNMQHAFAQFNPYSSDSKGSQFSMFDMIKKMPYDPADSVIALGLDAIISGFDFKLKENNMNMGLSLKQPIFAQGKVMVGLKIAKLYNHSLLCKFQDAKMGVKASITKQFYGSLFAVKTEAIKKNAVTLAEESHKLTVLKFVTGKASELDTLNSKVFLENSIIEYQDVQKNRRSILDALIKTVGVNEDVNSMELSGDFPNDTYDISIEAAIASIQIYNKKINQLKTNSQIQNLQIKLVKTDYFPIIFCGGSISKVTMFNDVDEIDWKNDQKVYIGLSYNLFNGFQRYNRLKQARSDSAMFNQSVLRTMEGLEIQTRTAWETMEMNKKRLGQTQLLLTVAQKAYSITKMAYDVGTKTLLDLQQSELSFNNAQLICTNAKFALHSAIVDLRLLIGDYLDEK